MREVKRSPLKLYWVETADHHEDWFVIARTAGEACEYFEDSEGYDDHDSTSHLVAHLPEELQSETGPYWTAPEVGPFTAPCWPSDDHIKACGGVYLMKDDTRVVQIGGRTYAEGLLEREVQDRYRGITPGGSPTSCAAGSVLGPDDNPYFEGAQLEERCLSPEFSPAGGQ